MDCPERCRGNQTIGASTDIFSFESQAINVAVNGVVIVTISIDHYV
jgi:hypothetical protein